MPRSYRPRSQLPATDGAALDPYRSLVLAVFQRAVEDARGRTAPLANRPVQELREEAHRWLASDAPATLLSLAGIEPDAVLPRVRERLGPG
jgi:hypothetical protein